VEPCARLSRERQKRLRLAQYFRAAQNLVSVLDVVEKSDPGWTSDMKRAGQAKEWRGPLRITQAKPWKLQHIREVQVIPQFRIELDSLDSALFKAFGIAVNPNARNPGQV
jgi:hypothetical protein